MTRISRKWRLLLALTLCASIAAFGTIVVAPTTVQAGFYDTAGFDAGGGGGSPTSSGDPDVPTGASKGVRTDGVVSTTVSTESQSTVVEDAHSEWTMRLVIVLLSLRGYLLRF